MATEKIPWMVSLHGGHSGQFCDHAKGTLRDMVEAATQQGFSILGLSEHCPRYEPRHLFETERAKGWTPEKLEEIFIAYSEEADLLIKEFSSRLEILKGFEAEYIYSDYTEKMCTLKESGKFDYMVGSVHHVDGRCIDGESEWFEEAIQHCGGLEGLALKYYQAVAHMISEISPDVVGHIDLISKVGDDFGNLDTPKIRQAVYEILQLSAEKNCILDLNVYPLRRGKPHPYPVPWIVQMAKETQVPFCFGDDSHAAHNVGVGIAEGREYLLAQGVKTVTMLTKASGQITQKEIPLV